MQREHAQMPYAVALGERGILASAQEAILLSFPQNAIEALAHPPVGARLAILPPPAPSAGGPPRSIRRDLVLVLSRHSRKKEAALAFLRYAVSAEAQQVVFANGGVPVRAVDVDAKSLSERQEFARRCATALDGCSVALYGLLPEVEGPLELALYEALCSTDPDAGAVKKAIDRLQDQIEHTRISSQEAKR